MRVLVIGAGPAGAAIGLLLARSGVDVTLVERERDFTRIFRGEGLMPSGIDALIEMGLDGVLEEIPTRKLLSWDLYIDGVETMSVPEPADELGKRAVRVIPQTLFLEKVIALAEAQPSFRVERGASVRGLVEENGRVVGVRIKDARGERDLRGDYVIGCDGRGSVIRKRAGLEVDELPERYDIAWFKLPAPEALAKRCSMLLMASRSHMAACYTSWDGRLQYALMIPKGGYAGMRETNWSEALAGAAVPPWLRDHVHSVATEIEGPVLLDVIVGRCRHWSLPGVLLLGDAAHPMSPIRAQGINHAFRDAIVAANHLVPLLLANAEPAALDAAAEAIQQEREPEVARAQALQYRDTRGLGTWYAPLLMAIARVAGRWLGRFAFSKRAWLEAQRDLRFGISEVKLSPDIANAGSPPNPR